MDENSQTVHHRGRMEAGHWRRENSHQKSKNESVFMIHQILEDKHQVNYSPPLERTVGVALATMHSISLGSESTL